MSAERDFRFNWLGFAALLAGTLAALVSAFFQDAAPPLYSGLNSDVLAIVNNEPVRHGDYELLLAAIGADKRTPTTAADRHLALSRLLQDELLLQEAVKRDLLRKNDSLRKEITITMLEIGASSGAPSNSDPTGSRALALDEYLKHLRNSAVLRWAADE